MTDKERLDKINQILNNSDLNELECFGKILGVMSDYNE